jgi:hypothetical protein
MVADPSVVMPVGDAVIVVVATEGAPIATATVTLFWSAAPSSVPEIVAVPITVDVSVAVYLPFPAYTGLVSTPRLVARTTLPLGLVSGFAFASRNCRVIVALPSVVMSAADVASVLLPATAAPGTTVTVSGLGREPVESVMVTDFEPTTVELNATAATPLASVLALDGKELPVPVALKVTLALGTTFPNASRTVTLMLLVPAPALIDVGVAEAVLADVEGAAGVTATPTVVVAGTPLSRAVIVLVPTIVPVIEPVATPFASVAIAG